ncbi:MAG: 5-formyltetrahydrofolate cyclo-ligase [Pyrinomonadaceae bacterium]
MTKTELRKTYLARQKALSSSERAEKSSVIALHFFECIDLSKTKLLHCFIPIERLNEVDTSIIHHALRENSPKTRIAVPRINFETRELESLICTSETKLIENAWGIREPVDAELVDPADIDVVLVPGLAFDRVGHRVGYGKGFYDRFLKTCRNDCVKIGLSYFGAVDEIDDIHEGDIALDLCITPDGAFATETPRRRKED